MPFTFELLHQIPQHQWCDQNTLVSCFEDVEFDETTMSLYFWVAASNSTMSMIWPTYFCGIFFTMWTLIKQPCPFTFEFWHQIKQCQWCDQNIFYEVFWQCGIWSNDHGPLHLSYTIKFHNGNNVTKILFIIEVFWQCGIQI